MKDIKDLGKQISRIRSKVGALNAAVEACDYIKISEKHEIDALLNQVNEKIDFIYERRREDITNRGLELD